MSTDINLMKIVLDRCCWYNSSELGCKLRQNSCELLIDLSIEIGPV